MKGLKKKTKFLLPLGASLLVVVAFQNCSGVNFEQAPIEQVSQSSTNQPQGSEDPDPTEELPQNELDVLSPILPEAPAPKDDEPTSSTPVPIPPPKEEEKPEIFQKSIAINPVSKKDGDLDIALIIDDSYSNVDNISRMLNGINDLLSKLQGKKYQISAFTMDNHINKMMKRQSRTLLDDFVITEYLDGTPLAQLANGGNSAQFLQKIQTHLDSI
ncbi:MAG TPA: hypothetical protein DCL41_04580, partial [Bdellovibrionales bacterium]|nr:hypothetical protein [Bdellovibrionales bacterium]